MAARRVSVKLATINQTMVEDASEYTAVLKSRKSITLYPKVDGHVTRIFVVSGDDVKPNQLLMEIDPLKQKAAVVSYQDAIQTAKADLDTARENLKSLEATKASRVSNLGFAQHQVSRYSALEKQGAVATQDLDQWVNQAKIAQGEMDNVEALIKAQKATIFKLERAIHQADASLKAQQEELNYHNIKAPFHGMVGDIPVKLGDYVTPSTKLTSLTENKPLEVYVSVPTDRANQLHLGMNIELLDEKEKLLGTSRVFFISPSVDETSQSILIKSAFANADCRLRADQLVRAKVIWSRKPGVLVPTNGVAHSAGQDFVFVAQAEGPDKMLARQIPVKLGNIERDSYQILAGVKAGDRIVVSGIQNLVDGAPITETN